MESNISSTTAIDYSEILIQENAFEAKILIPVTVYLVILMILGITGNSLVIYVYKVRFYRSTSRIFILCMASFDLLTCIFGIPYHILDTTFPYMFVWDSVCKSLSFCLTFTILASIFILDLIAIDRYRKVCKPFGTLLTGKGSKTLSGVAVLASVICAFPTIFVYGSADVQTFHFPNITGKECYISDDYLESSFPLIYNCIITSIFVLSVLLLAILYSFVGRTIWKRRKFNEWNGSRGSRGSLGNSPKTSIQHINSTSEGDHNELTHRVHFINGQEKADDATVHFLGTQHPSSNVASSSTDITREHDNKKRPMSSVSSLGSGEDGNGRFITKCNSKPHTKRKYKRTIRITQMLFIVTLVFIVSFFPYLIIQTLNEVNQNFWNDMSLAEIVIFNFLLRTYFINSVVNPVIYWYWDIKFKEEVTKVLKNIRSCKC